MGPLFPSSCTCTPTKLGFVLACSEKIEVPLGFFSDTITASMEFEPCAAAAHATVSVTDSEGLIKKATDGAGFSEGITAGKAKHFAIPGCGFDAKSIGLGEIGVFMDVSLGGNPDKLTLGVSLDICAGTSLGCCSAGSSSAIGKVCPKGIPIELLKGTFSFGDNVCGAPAKPKPAGIGGGAVGGVIGAFVILGAAGFLYRRKQLKDAEDYDAEDNKDDLREDLVVEGGDEHYA
jgi:hypothetical protein